MTTSGMAEEFSRSILKMVLAVSSGARSAIALANELSCEN
jgi:hypothetical protein